uniref:Uncharacterized protein n=1 Tax=Nelumbo nucifera TaxID=4432 RepID=A0A822YZX6_NELNU|nr:TPA_asm: hypothetical protein HUJ06_007450 [Nelumbo nucifera]
MFVSIAPYLTASFSQEHNSGAILIKIKINGKLEWKVGTFGSPEAIISTSTVRLISPLAVETQGFPLERPSSTNWYNPMASMSKLSTLKSEVSNRR